MLGGSIGSMVKGFALFTGVTMGASALISIGKEAFNSAGRLVDLRAKTDLTLGTLQRMEFAAGQAGGTLEGLADASFKLGIRLSGGSGSVKKAVEEVGVSFDALSRMNPSEQFETIVAALGNVQDATKRNELGVIIFGKVWTQVASVAAQDWKALAAAASVSSDEQIEALDDAADHFDKVVARMKNAAKSLGGEVFRLIEQTARNSFLPDRAKMKAQADAEAAAVAASKEQLKQATVATASYTEQLAKLDAQLRALTPEQRKQIDAALAMGVSADDLEDKYGLLDGALRRYGAGQKEATKAMSESERVALRASEAMKSLHDSLLSLDDIDLAEKTLTALKGVDIGTLLPEQQARVNKTMSDAIAVYRNLGRQVPLAITAAFDQSLQAITAGTSDIVRQLGMFTGINTDAMADSARAGQNAMQGLTPDGLLQSSTFSKGELSHLLFAAPDHLGMIQERTEGVVDTFNLWGDALQMLTGSLDDLGDNASGAFASISQAAASAMAAFAMNADGQMAIGQAGMAWLSSSSVNGRAITGKERIAGAGMVAAGVGNAFQSLKGFNAATTTGDSRGGRAARGAAMGAQAGMNFGPYGAALGAGFGALSGAMNDPALEGRKAHIAFLKDLSLRFEEVATSAQKAEVEAKSLHSVAEGGRTKAWHQGLMLVQQAYKDLGQTAEQATADFEALFEAAEDGPDAAAKSIERMNQLLERQQGLFDARARKQDMLNEAVQRWGLSFEEAGQGFERGQLAEQAERFIEDWQLADRVWGESRHRGWKDGRVAQCLRTARDCDRHGSPRSDEADHRDPD